MCSIVYSLAKRDFLVISFLEQDAKSPPANAGGRLGVWAYFPVLWKVEVGQFLQPPKAVATA
jgi:hypothetical protein